MLAGVVDVIGEEEPLLSRQRSGSLTIPGSGRRRRTSSSSSGAAARRRSSAQGNNVLARILEENDEQGRRNRGKVWMKNIISIVGIMILGAVGWAMAWGSGAWRPTPVGSGAGAVTGAGDGDGDTGPVGAQILGYVSAVAYLGARIPQIVKNAREKSCEGTAPYDPFIPSPKQRPSRSH
jgi:solute carrier family 66 (lysosomal lysine-arginine transporter), member 1